MKMKLYLLSGLIFCVFHTQAQNPVNQSKSALVLNLGSTPGIGFTYQFKPKLTASISYAFFSYNLNQTLNLGGEDLGLKGKLNMSLPSLSLAYSPKANGLINLVGGFTYLLDNKFSMRFGPKGAYEVNGNTFTGEEIGDVLFEMDYSKSFAPFGMISIGRSIPKKRIGFGVDFGSIYLSQPKITLEGSKRLKDMSEELTKIEENTRDWRYWPILNLKVRVKL
jgi:hypothetical protein